MSIKKVRGHMRLSPNASPHLLLIQFHIFHPSVCFFDEKHVATWGCAPYLLSEKYPHTFLSLLPTASTPDRQQPLFPIQKMQAVSVLPLRLPLTSDILPLMSPDHGGVGARMAGILTPLYEVEKNS